MADPAIGAVLQLQNRVGTSFAGVQNLLAPPERADALLQAGATAQGTSLLFGIRDVQTEMLYCLQDIKSVLNKQLDFEEDEARRLREQQAELEKENRGGGRGVGMSDTSGTPDIGGGEEEAGGGLFSTFGPALAAWVGAGGIKKLAKGFGLRFLKGGAVFMLADLLDDEIAKVIPEGDFQDFVANDAKWIALGGAVGGLPGAIAAFGLVGMTGVLDYIQGESEKLSVTDVAGVAVSGGLLAKYGGPKIAKFLAARGLTGAATLFGAAALTPVIVATGAALAIGVGARFLADKNDEYQQQTLDSLENLTQKTDEELSKRFAQAEESFLENIGFGGIFGTEQSELGQAQTATAQALDVAGRDDEDLTDKNVKDLVELADKTVNIDDEDLKVILQDKSKVKNLTQVIDNLRKLAVKGELGPDGKRILTNMLMFGDRLQSVAMQMEKETGRSTAVTSGIIAGTSGFKGGDLLEKVGEAEMAMQTATTDINRLTKNLADIESGNKTADELGFKSKRQIENQLEQAQRELKKQQENMEQLKGNRNFNQQVGFSLDDLRSIYTDDELKVLIEKSMTNTGATNIAPPPQTQDTGLNVVGSGNTSSSTTKVDSSSTFVGPMTTDVDPGLKRATTGYDY